MSVLSRIFNQWVLRAASVLLAIAIAACSDHTDKELAVLKALDESLIASNLTIQRSTEIILRVLEQKKFERVYGDRAPIWYSKAQDVQKKARTVCNNIEELKKTLKKDAGIGESANLSAKAETSVTHFFDNGEKGKELFNKLSRFKTEVFAIDSQFAHAFLNTLFVISESFENLKGNEEDFNNMFLKRMSNAAALAMLSKFQNNISVCENRIIQFCNYNVGAFIEDFNSYSAIISQNSSYVRGSEEIEIQAGVGYFSKNSKPEIIVGGKVVTLDESGVAVYKFNASSKPGKHRVPVRINLIDEDGKRMSIEKIVEYTVAPVTESRN